MNRQLLSLARHEALRASDAENRATGKKAVGLTLLGVVLGVPVAVWGAFNGNTICIVAGIGLAAVLAGLGLMPVRSTDNLMKSYFASESLEAYRATAVDYLVERGAERKTIVFNNNIMDAVVEVSAEFNGNNKIIFMIAGADGQVKLYERPDAVKTRRQEMLRKELEFMKASLEPAPETTLLPTVK